MTRLHRTPLTLPEKIDFAARALATQDRHGAISDLSREFAVSRPTLYEARETLTEVLEAHFKKSEPGSKPVCVMVDEGQLDGPTVALRDMSPNSIRALEDMLPIIYP